MEYELIFTISAVIVGVLSIFNILYTLKLLNNCLILYKAKVITDDITVGDYIHIQGNVKMPTIKSPFFNKQCVYWKTYIWAWFETKRKKPEKGMQEHSPLLEVKESEMPPLMVSQSGFLAHIDLSRLSSTMLNLVRKEDRQTSPPNEATAKLAKEKYKAYRIHEYRLPNDASVAVWGKVDSINKNLVTIVGSKDSKYPCFLYNGNASAIYHRLIKRIFLSLCVIALCGLFLLMLERLLEFGFFGLIASAVVIAYFQYLSKKKLFELK